VNELERVLQLIEAYRKSGTSRRAFARRRGLHPSALSRILRVGELPDELLRGLAAFERLSRTHLEVIATAPAERRGELVSQAREGRSTYRLRDRRETMAVAVGATVEATPAPVSETAADPRTLALARTLGATAEETRAFALELLSVLLRSSPERVRASLEQFRAASGPRPRATP